MSTGKIADTLGIIGFIGAIVAGFWGAVIASQLMVALAVLYVIAFLSFKVWQLSNENKSLKASISRRITPSIDIRRFYDESIWISSSRKNRQHIQADFIQWDECTLMLWVYVPPRGEGLRDSNSNRCLFSHTTGHTEQLANFNGFTLRHNDNKRWHFSFTSGKAKYPPHGIFIEDGLEAGWHHFLLQWNKLKPELQLLIDKGARGSARLSAFLSYWPEQYADNITIGAWESGKSETYCETKLLSLWICNKYLSMDDELLRTHYSRQP